MASAIAGAEEVTRWKEDPASGKLVAHPSAAKSETGAIDRIELYGPRDRRRFSLDEALDWLANPMTGSSYQVELFEAPPPRSDWDAAGPDRQRLYATFTEGLAALGQGLTVQRLKTTAREQPQLALRLGASAEPPTVRLLVPAAAERRHPRQLAPFDASADRHGRLLKFLDSHPLVRRIELPPVLTRTEAADRPPRPSAAAGRARPTQAIVPERLTTRTYPKIGVVDGGIGPALADWVIDRWDILDAGDVDAAHGTFIGGLTVLGAALNGDEVCREPDGTELVDIAVFPDEASPTAFSSYYPDGLSQFFDEVGYAVADAKARHDVRVFNMSLNIQHQAEPDRYGAYAARLDAIAEANNAVFFLSAGNTGPQSLRPEWAVDETQALVGLASARNDGLLMPAESVRNVSVAALNPPGLANALAFAPARYSRRGPGLRAGVKPDLAQIGGSGSPQAPHGHGLYSVTPRERRLRRLRHELCRTPGGQNRGGARCGHRRRSVARGP